jgi:hypothetical protein
MSEIESVEGAKGSKAIQKIKAYTESNTGDAETPSSPLQNFASLLQSFGQTLTGTDSYKQLLTDLFAGNPRPSYKDGLLGFSTTGLTASHKEALIKGMQGMIDQVLPGTMNVVEKDGMIGIEAPGLESKDLQALAALLLGYTDLTRAITTEQKAKLTRTLQVSSGNPATGPKSKDQAVPIEAPAPGTKPMSPSDWALLLGKLNIETNTMNLDAQMFANEAMAKLQKMMGEENVKAMLEGFQKMAEAQAKADKWGIFSQIAAWTMIVVGALLTATGVGAGAGIALMMGGIMTLALQTEVGQQVMKAIVDFIAPGVVAVLNAVMDSLAEIGSLFGADKAWAEKAKAGIEEYKEVITQVVVAVIMIVATMGAAAGAAGAMTAVNAVSATTRTITQAVATIMSKIAEAVSKFANITVKTLTVTARTVQIGLEVGQSAMDATFSVQQGKLTIKIGEAQSRQISIDAMLTGVQDAITLLNKAMTDILDSTASTVNSTTSILAQGGSAMANSYKFRTA